MEENTSRVNNRIRQIAWMVVGLPAIFLLGLGSRYLKWRQDEMAEARQQKEVAALYEQVNPADGFALSVSYGNLGPRLEAVMNFWGR